MQFERFVENDGGLAVVELEFESAARLVFPFRAFGGEDGVFLDKVGGVFEPVAQIPEFLHLFGALQPSVEVAAFVDDFLNSDEIGHVGGVAFEFHHLVGYAHHFGSHVGCELAPNAEVFRYKFGVGLLLSLVGAFVLVEESPQFVGVFACGKGEGVFAFLLRTGKSCYAQCK